LQCGQSTIICPCSTAPMLNPSDMQMLRFLGQQLSIPDFQPLLVR
jgi:hypothetical protein